MHLSRWIAKSLVAVILAFMPMASHAAVFVSVGIAPPELPVYEQPDCPGDGYLWTPGYWAYGPYGYYWVPGVWVQPPGLGLLWTPGYWGWGDGGYFFHDGYWGTEVGFYGGINYGFGYVGDGYYGGRWDHGHFFYNRAFNRGNFHSAYEDRSHMGSNTRTSFNGGVGGVHAVETADQRKFESAHHIAPTANQVSHRELASQDRSQLASVNGGHPATLASVRTTSYAAIAHQHAAARPLTEADRANAAGTGKRGKTETSSDKRTTHTDEATTGKTHRDVTEPTHTTHTTHTEHTVSHRATPETTHHTGGSSTHHSTPAPRRTAPAGGGHKSGGGSGSDKKDH